jgi:L-amino acid N-acyltransferase YncA
MAIIITAMTGADWPDVKRIYQEGIDSGNATFAIAPPVSWDEWCRGKINSCSLVARNDDTIVGWATLSSTSGRAVYAGVAEVSIYVGIAAQGKRIGTALLRELICISEANGIWTLQAGIFPENQPSLQLHLEQGFRVVGIRQKLGRMEYGALRGQWRDVVLMERRSTIVGVSSAI